MTIILSIFCISALIGILTYIVIKVTNDDVHTSKALEVPKKPEPTVQISLNLYDKREALEGTYYKVPFSHAAFYISDCVFQYVDNDKGHKLDLNFKRIKDKQ